MAPRDSRRGGPRAETAPKENGDQTASAPAGSTIAGQRRDKPVYTYDIPEGHPCPPFRKKRVPLDPEKDGREKEFKYWHWNGRRWVPGLGEYRESANDILYGLPRLLEALARGDDVAWTEGERDADTVTRVIGTVAASHHGGALKIYPGQVEWFRGFEGNVMLFADDDAPGWADVRKRYDMLRAAGLEPHQLHIRLPAEGCKDITEHFERGYGPADLRKWDYIRLAAVTDKPEVKQAASVPYTAGDWEGLRDENVVPRRIVPSSRGKGGKGRKPRADNQAKILLDILRERFELVRDENGELYGIDRQAPAHVAIPALERGGGLRGALAAAFHEKKGSVPSQNALASISVLVEIEGAKAPQITLPLRTARADDGAIWIDIGDDTGRAVKVIPDKWTIEDRAPFPFRRTTATRPLRVDKSVPADIEPFRALFNLSDGQWDFLLNWMIIAYVPGIPHAVPVILGGPGRAKTTLCIMVLEVTDPSHGALSGVSLNEKDLRTHAQGSWVIGLENVSHISREISDFLCRLVTGHQSRERLYYSNSEIKIVALGRRVIIMNGIAITGIRQDLQDRAVNIHPEPIGREDRRTDAEIREEFEAAVPGAISYILDSLAAAMVRERDSLDQLDELPRMADFAQWLAYLDAVRETETLEGFTATVRRDAIQSALESPVGAALREWLSWHRKHRENEHGDGQDQHTHAGHAPGAPGHAHREDGSIRYWRKSASQWLTELPQPDTIDGRRDWPSTARGFANQMRLIENGLYQDG